MKASRGGCRIGVDVGGTFTDVVLHDPRSGALHVAKTLTTPGDLARAVMAGVDAVLAESGKRPSDVSALLHATTVATNAILERKGARTALLTTEGFRDVLILGRQKRYETYDLYFRKPAPLTRRRHVHEVRERVDADGNVVSAPGSGSAYYSGSDAGVHVDLGDGKAERGGHAAGDVLRNIGHVRGSSHGDTLIGDGTSNTLQGRSGADSLSGGLDNDKLVGNQGADTLSGGDDRDTLWGGTGADSLDGGAGGDLLEGGAGGDRLDGGAGRDTVRYGGSNEGVKIDLQAAAQNRAGASGGHAQGDVFVVASGAAVTSIENVDGSRHDDSLTGDTAANKLAGAQGNDAVDGGSGDDTLWGGSGDDTVQGREGDDVVKGGAGDDRLDGGRGSDTIDGGAGRDTLSYADSESAVTVDLASGAAQTGGVGHSRGDVLTRVRGDADTSTIEDLIGSNHDDSLTGDDQDNRIEGGRGDDAIGGSSGADTLIGGAGRDTVRGGADTDSLDGADSIDGGSGADSLYGGPGSDTITGGRDADTADGGDSLFGGQGDDDLTGGRGNDRIYGDDVARTDTLGGDDYLDGGHGVDLLYGGYGNDVLIGGEDSNSFDGADSLYGDHGNDSLSGGDGADLLVGGAGNDTLVGGGGDDRIGGKSFETGSDRFIGGEGSDVFYNGSVSSHITIVDFQDDASGPQDRIDLSAFGLGSTPTAVARGRDAVIEIGGGEASVVIENYLIDHQLSDLAASDFIL